MLRLPVRAGDEREVLLRGGRDGKVDVLAVSAHRDVAGGVVGGERGGDAAAEPDTVLAGTALAGRSATCQSLMSRFSMQVCTCADEMPVALAMSQVWARSASETASLTPTRR